MKKKISILFMVMMMATTMFLVGCSENNDSAIDEMTDPNNATERDEDYETEDNEMEAGNADDMGEIDDSSDSKQKTDNN